MQNFGTREPAVALALAQMWDTVTIRAYNGPQGAVLVNKANEELPKLYYTDRTLRVTQAPTNVGTLYQYACDRQVITGSIGGSDGNNQNST